MSEPSPKPRATPARRETIENLVDALAGILEHGSPDVPDWVAQELTFGQMRLLFLLAKHGPSPVGRVAEWLGVGLPAASGIVDRVERHGLLERRRRNDDRRVVECALTDKGRALLDEIAGMRREIMRQTLGGLSDDDLAELSRLARKLTAYLQEQPLVPDRSTAASPWVPPRSSG